MDDRIELALGMGMASIAIHQGIITLLIKRNIIKPEDVRTVLDYASLTAEQQIGRLEPSLAAVLIHAQKQVEMLLRTLEATVDEMRENSIPP